MTKLTSAVETLQQLRNGDTSAETLFNQSLQLIEQTNDEYRPFAYVAAQSEQTQSESMLKGLPISVKDQIHVAGMPCTSGYEQLNNFVPQEDATVVRTLRKAGAQILGKTNLPPLALDFQTFNSLHGLTKNPWNPDYTAGGSSGGGAVAVALGLSFADIGADLGGSLRLPASFCGVCSLMPSDGRLPLDGSLTLIERAGLEIKYLPRIGPIARTVEDLQLVWHALSGESPSLVRTARVGLLPAHPLLPLHPEIEASFNSFADRLQAAAGVDVERASPDRFEWETGWRAYGIVQGHQIGETIPLLQRWIGRFLSRGAMGRSPHFIKPIQDGYLRRTAQFEESLATRAELAAALDRFLDRYDVWALPVSLVPAFKHLKPSFERGFLRDYDHMFDINGQSINYFEALTRLTTLFNLTGHPIVTIPAGRDSRSGVPIGVQLVGKPGEESRLLAVARLLETSI